MSIAAITSVTTIISVPGESPLMTFFRALPIAMIIILNIVSEVIILMYHDIPLCNQEERKISKHKTAFKIARFLQVIVVVSWLGAFFYMAYVAANVNCNDMCQCEIYNPNMTCSSPLCPYGPNCLMPHCSFNVSTQCTLNGTSTYLPNTIPGNFTSNCTETTSALTCTQSNPTAVSCILLALVILESFYNTVGMFFKAYILPIMLPANVLFLIYWMNDDTDKMVLRIGKSEFGSNWDLSHLGQVVTDVQQILMTESLW